MRVSRTRVGDARALYGLGLEGFQVSGVGIMRFGVALSEAS